MHLFEKFTRCAKICGLLLLLSFSGADWLGRQTPITWSDYSALTIWTVDHKDEGTNEMIVAKCQNQCLQQSRYFFLFFLRNHPKLALLIIWMAAFFDLLRGNSNLWKFTFSVVELPCWNRLKIELLPGNRTEKVGFLVEGGFHGISQLAFLHYPFCCKWRWHLWTKVLFCAVLLAGRRNLTLPNNFLLFSFDDQ